MHGQDYSDEDYSDEDHGMGTIRSRDEPFSGMALACPALLG
jgi:hypothetical protein